MASSSSEMKSLPIIGKKVHNNRAHIHKPLKMLFYLKKIIKIIDVFFKGTKMQRWNTHD